MERPITPVPIQPTRVFDGVTESVVVLAIEWWKRSGDERLGWVRQVNER